MHFERNIRRENTGLVVGKMECDDSTTDDDATEDEEDKTAVDVTPGSLINDGKTETKW